MTRNGNGRQVPYSRDAEEALLGICLMGLYDDTGVRALTRQVDPDDFYAPAHKVLAGAIAGLAAAGAAVEPRTVTSWLGERGLLGEVKGAASGLEGAHYLVHLLTNAPSARTVATYAATVVEHAARRRLLAALAEATDGAYDRAVPLEAVTGRLVEQVRKIDAPTETEQVPDLEEFLREPHEYRWLMPGVLERTERVIVTGGEGGGKSELLRQLAVQFAAGVHPWRWDRHEPVTALLVDLENSKPQVARRMRPLYELVAGANRQQALGDTGERFDPRRVHVACRPQGVDLLSRRDRAWFTAAVDAARPDVVLTGSLYKMHRGNPNDEEPAATLAAYLDELRVTYDVALVIEAHAPHGADGGRQRTLRPAGASLWMRWPEYGLGIRKVESGERHQGHYELHHWRGGRDSSRTWPRYLKHGHTWPWVDAYANEDPAEEQF